ncbi:transient receptor potential cation channel subfamily A member 1 homolog [Mercenaria mercenaria]|uniref:transient receptor potential cation channel subfamily A member 1 homolog n=1 Tax=Mercenaria mercenaria TaxID=6596 RepID=UPI00234FADCF|nr:transient receptor potential cation channel subfamily A member 1 homolog [Mercenaria mercenaria]
MKCSEGKSALHYAVIQNDKDSVEILLQEQVDVNQKDKDERTPLSYAAETGLVEITKMLDKHKASDLPDVTEMRPIHYAAKNGHLEVVESLLNGECPWKKTKDGRNCLDIAIDEKHEETVRVMIKNKNWKKFLQNTTGKYQTPMRKLISDMPDVAREVFNLCTTPNGHDSNFSVTFDYELLDDKDLLGKRKNPGKNIYVTHRNTSGYLNSFFS